MFSYEAGPNAVDELDSKGGIETYLDQVQHMLDMQDLLWHCCS